MKINIVSVGNMKEEYFTKAFDEYFKRMSKYANIKTIQLKEQTKLSNIALTIERESEDIAKNLVGHTILLDIKGKEYTSTEFSKKIQNLKCSGTSQITFIIGGSYGVSEKVKEMVKERISFSQMTFPHQLFKVMLIEQIYRAYQIENNTPYHK